MVKYVQDNNYLPIGNMVSRNVSKHPYGSSNTDCCETYVNQQSKRKIGIIVMSFRAAPKTAVCTYDFSFLMSFYDGVKFVILFPSHILACKGYYNQVHTSIYATSCSVVGIQASIKLNINVSYPL